MWTPDSQFPKSCAVRSALDRAFRLTVPEWLDVIFYLQ